MDLVNDRERMDTLENAILKNKCERRNNKQAEENSGDVAVFPTLTIRGPGQDCNPRKIIDTTKKKKKRHQCKKGSATCDTDKLAIY